MDLHSNPPLKLCSPGGGPEVGPKWKPVVEVHPRLPFAIYELVHRASKQLGFALRSDPAMPPCNPADGSLNTEVAVALLVHRQLCHLGDSPKTLHDTRMLKKKDTGRARFQVLVRKPSREETNDEVLGRYIFDRCRVKGQMLLRSRCVQGHSGSTLRNATRVGQDFAQDCKYPFLLMHNSERPRE
jgi:hypothetical protein